MKKKELNKKFNLEKKVKSNKLTFVDRLKKNMNFKHLKKTNEQTD